MLRPSYTELMDIINNDELADSKITSRYTIVLAAAKRARQIINGELPMTKATTDRAVSIAVKEMSESKILIKVEEDLMDGNYERMLKSQNKFKNITAVTKDDLREELKDKYDPSEYKSLDEDDEDEDDDDDRDDSYKNDYDEEDEDEEGNERKIPYSYEKDDYEDEENE